MIHPARNVAGNATPPAEQGAPDDFLQFTSLLVHDLEGPLASMKTVLRLMEAGRYDPSKELHRNLVKSTRIAVERSEAIIHDLMTAAKSERMGLRVDLEQVDLPTVLQSSVAMAESVAQEYGVSLLYLPVDVPCRVVADRDLLARVVDNLIFNAIRHTPSRGEISVDYEVRSREVEVSVVDSGNGLGEINPEDLFSKYSQLKLRQEKLHRGVGLGLYFCRLAVEEMNGKIWAENAPGGGTRFAFRVPIGG